MNSYSEPHARNVNAIASNFYINKRYIKTVINHFNVVTNIQSNIWEVIKHNYLLFFIFKTRLFKTCLCVIVENAL